MPQLSKDELIDILEHIGQLLELKGEVVFKVRAYQNAARALETFSGNIVQTAADGKLSEIDGIGKAIAEKLTTLIDTGTLPYYEELKAQFPVGLFEMFELQGVGPKKIKALWDQLGITTVEALEAGCKDGRVAALAGFGKKTADNILASIEARRKHSGRFRLGDIAHEAERMCEDLRGLPDVNRVSVCGSYRPRRPKRCPSFS
jgi:DNA polymerase (family X)